jgi:hypothetical protein
VIVYLFCNFPSPCTFFVQYSTGNCDIAQAVTTGHRDGLVPLGYKVTLDEGVYTVKLPKGMKRLSIR